MSKKFKTYEDLLIEKQKIEELFEIQKTLVKIELNEIKQELSPAINALDFFKTLTLRNKGNPVVQSGLTMLIDSLSKKTEGKDAGFLRSTVMPFFAKNVASNILTEKWPVYIHDIVAIFSKEEEKETEESQTPSAS